MQEYSSEWLSRPIQIRLGEELWAAVESFRRAEPDIPTRPEAVRRLLGLALRFRTPEERGSAAA
jgi:hypothetical protein